MSFFPTPPKSLTEAGLSDGYTEQLLLKALDALHAATGAKLALRCALPANSVRERMSNLKQRQLVVHLSATSVAGDYSYELSQKGRDLVESLKRSSAWSGAAPVRMSVWREAMHSQSIRGQPIKKARLWRALDDIDLPEKVMRRLGMALSTGQALFLYGDPGNGKTSVAERICRAVPSAIFVPKMVIVEGQLIRVFDPMVHTPIESEHRYDPRWVLCERPTVIAGGELRLETLELTYNPHLGICEAPPQLKAAGGTLLIDDFGRQFVSPRDLLNRWIVPLERRIDYLSLPDGTKLQVPFDPFIVFSTNLDPLELVDEAFLRRIPYKIKLNDPSEEVFRDLMRVNAKRLGLELPPESVDYLITTYYPQRPFRGCHPRDLLTQVLHRQQFLGRPLVVSTAALNEVALNYFVEMT